MKYKLVIISLLVLMSVANPVMSQDTIDRSGLTREEGRWSVVEYTESIYPGYPEYYPLIITIASLGRLPRDLIELTNYTNTVFISLYIISANLSSIDSIIRYRDTDELVGEDPIEFKFEVTKEMAKNVKTIRFEVSLTPFNLTDVLTDDIYNILVEIRQEATGLDIILQFIFVFTLPIFVTVFYFSHRHYNNKVIENVGYHQLPKYWYSSIKNSRFFKFLKIFGLALVIGILLSLVIYLGVFVYNRFLFRFF